MASGSSRDLEQIVRDGLSTLVFAFGHKVGIIDAFIEFKNPCTAEELSEKSGQKLRYIQEWLGCMISAGIVKLHEDGKYSLPFEKSLLKTSGIVASVLPIFSEMFPQLEKVMSKDGPRGYGYYDPFLALLDTYRTPEALQEWNKNLLRPVLELKPGTEFTLLDIGCGYGKHTREVAKMYPNCTIYGIDSDKVSIDQAIKELQKSEQKNIIYIHMKGGQLPQDWTEKFDFVLINDVLHDAYDVDGILKETKRVLKPDGYGMAYDPPVSSYPQKQVNEPKAQFFLPFSLFICLPVSLSGPFGEGRGVGWGYERKKQEIEEHGFRVIKVGEKDTDTVQEGIVFSKANP
ncbi:uncharacterized protein LOC133194164 [Saccostrea echinata]|uniref:uncharacterized protein LOC133194164 n=1 Tax=Saccostrea echinata TaxID=191078 RepID=UPI002A83A9EC|nr:uncharacterized protein LOC133194164 [Saccostrea echinata]